jgi:hypothetical protein
MPNRYEIVRPLVINHTTYLPGDVLVLTDGVWCAVRALPTDAVEAAINSQPDAVRGERVTPPHLRVV